MKPFSAQPRPSTMVLRRVAALLLPACALLAQDAPTFRTSTRLVQVDVVVKAKDAPVQGLTKEDFQVFDNGKPQQIAVFSVRDSKAIRPEVAPLPKGVVTNRPQFRGPEPVSATVVLIDSQNTQPEDQGYARLQALKYLDQASRAETVAIYSLDSVLKVLQDFTEDRVLLRAAIDGFHMTQSLNMQDGTPGSPGLLTGLTGNAANAMRAANFQRQADITTAAFQSIALHLTGLPGRKKFIWITAAPPLTFTQDNERNGVTLSEFTNLSSQIFAPMKLMNDANVAIYPIDPRGVLVSRTDPGITTMIRLAEMTGGKAYYGDNDLSVGIEEAFSDTDLTYTLGFYPIDEGQIESVHSISVKVNRAGADPRYRKSYTPEPVVRPPDEKTRKATLSAWLRQPLESTEIPIRAKATPAPGKLGYYDVEVSVDPLALKLELKDELFTGSLEIALVPDIDNKIKGLHQTMKVSLTQQRLLETTETGVPFKSQVRVTNSKGKMLSKRLHLVIMDPATGKTGSVRIPLN